MHLYKMALLDKNCIFHLMQPIVKFMFFNNWPQNDEFYTLKLCNNRQIDGEDFVNFRGVLTRKSELFWPHCVKLLLPFY